MGLTKFWSSFAGLAVQFCFVLFCFVSFSKSLFTSLGRNFFLKAKKASKTRFLSFINDVEY